MATERSGEENMNKSKEQMRKDAKNRSREREEKEKRGKRSNTWNPDRNNRGSYAPGLEHPGARLPWIGASGSP